MSTHISTVTPLYMMGFGVKPAPMLVVRVPVQKRWKRRGAFRADKVRTRFIDVPSSEIVCMHGKYYAHPETLKRIREEADRRARNNPGLVSENAVPETR